MTKTLPLLLAAALLAACSADDGDRVLGRVGQGIDERPAPALLAVLARTQGLPQDQVDPMPSAERQPAQVRPTARRRGRVVRTRARRAAPSAAETAPAPQ